MMMRHRLRHRHRHRLRHRHRQTDLCSVFKASSFQPPVLTDMTLPA